MQPRDAVIVGYTRSPVGRYAGALSPLRPDSLAAHVLRALVDRTGIDPADVDDVIIVLDRLVRGGVRRVHAQRPLRGFVFGVGGSC